MEGGAFTALGVGQESLNDGTCDSFQPQAAQWAPSECFCNSGWPLSTLIAHLYHALCQGRVHGSSSLNEHTFKNVAANHRPTFVAALLGEYYTSVDGLELYPTQLDAPLSEYAIRIDIRVDLGLRFDGQTHHPSTF